LEGSSIKLEYEMVLTAGAFTQGLYLEWVSEAKRHLRCEKKNHHLFRIQREAPDLRRIWLIVPKLTNGSPPASRNSRPIHEECAWFIVGVQSRKQNVGMSIGAHINLNLLAGVGGGHATGYVHSFR
jgi:hypothetical protein